MRLWCDADTASDDKRGYIEAFAAGRCSRHRNFTCCSTPITDKSVCDVCLFMWLGNQGNQQQIYGFVLFVTRIYYYLRFAQESGCFPMSSQSTQQLFRVAVFSVVRQTRRDVLHGIYYTMWMRNATKFFVTVRNLRLATTETRALTPYSCYLVWFLILYFKSRFFLLNALSE